MTARRRLSLNRLTKATWLKRGSFDGSVGGWWRNSAVVSRTRLSAAFFSGFRSVRGTSGVPSKPAACTSADSSSVVFRVTSSRSGICSAVPSLTQRVPAGSGSPKRL